MLNGDWSCSGVGGNLRKFSLKENVRYTSELKKVKKTKNKTTTTTTNKMHHITIRPNKQLNPQIKSFKLYFQQFMCPIVSKPFNNVCSHVVSHHCMVYLFKLQDQKKATQNSDVINLYIMS